VWSLRPRNLWTTYWFWRQWRTDDPSEGRGSVLFKALMSPFFFYSMANQVKEEAERKEVACRYSPTVLAGMLLGSVIAMYIIPDDFVAAFDGVGPALSADFRSAHHQRCE
jgi:hypothetical protein